MNAYQIQQQLRRLEYVSIPWIQYSFELPYSQAKDFLARLQQRGWVEKTVHGNRYRIRKENLKLRFIRPEEVDDLILDISNDCACALRCLKAGKCADRQELENAIDDDDDTVEAIRVLEKHRLIYQADGLYFPCVSEKALGVLISVGNAKRHMRVVGNLAGNLEKMMQMREFFDILFANDD